MAPILVACCGNPLAGDDAFGHLVAEELQHDPMVGVEVLDLAMNPASLLDQNLEGRRVLLIVDAAEVPGARRGRCWSGNGASRAGQGYRPRQPSARMGCRSWTSWNWQIDSGCCRA